MNSLPDKSSRRRYPGSTPPEEAPTRIVLGEDSLHADSHASTVELANASPGTGSSHQGPLLERSGSSLVTNEKTVISKRVPADEAPPPIHIGPLESRKSLEGETLDHFKLESYVGGGGMGAVYRAHDTRLNRSVAVKILSRDQSDSETVRRFRNEAQSAARLDHPHIARVYYVGEDKGWNFIVFEFIEGVNLREIVERNGPLSIAEALDYTLQVAEALDHAAARDVVHRDIKPSNVLVADDGRVKLVDMGLARLHQVESGSEDLTQSGVTLGTFDYISPEQARDPRSADVRSDIYSLGCTLYFILVGRAPFPDGTALQKLIRHNSDEPPDVRLFRPDTPDEVVAILTRALAKKPEQRFQSPAELILAIDRVSQRLHLNLGASSSSRTPIHWPSKNEAPLSWWQRWMPLAVAVLILCTLALLPDNWSHQSSRVAPRLPEGKINHPAIPAPDAPSVVKRGPFLAEKSIPTPAPASTSDSRATPLVQDQGSLAQSSSAADVADVPPETESPSASILETMPKIDSLSPDLIATSPVTATKRRVIVRPEATSNTEGDAEVVESFAKACRYAEEHPDIELIELAFNSKQSASLEIASKQLTIRRSAGFSPELVFRPSPDAHGDDRNAIRITLPGSKIRWEDVRFRFEVPSPRSDWSLFQFSAGSMLEFDRCVATIVDTAGSSISTRQVAVFRPGPPVTTTDEFDDYSSSVTSSIDLQRSVFRGEGNVLQLPEDVPVRVQIGSSFVAMAGRLLQTSGLAEKPSPTQHIALDLDRSTLYLASGEALIGAGKEAAPGVLQEYPFRMEVRIEQRNCVLVTDTQASLLEYRAGDTSNPLVSFRGANNYYPRTNIFLTHVYRRDGRQETDLISFDSLPPWATDRNADQGTISGPPADTRPHEHTPADYLLKSPADAQAGCEPELLPPESSLRRPVVGTSGMSTMKPDMSSPPMMDEKTLRTMP